MCTHTYREQWPLGQKEGATEVMGLKNTVMEYYTCTLWQQRLAIKNLMEEVSRKFRDSIYVLCKFIRIFKSGIYTWGVGIVVLCTIFASRILVLVEQQDLFSIYLL